MNSIIDSLLLTTVGVFIGYLAKAVYDDFTMPRLMIQNDTYYVNLPNFQLYLPYTRLTQPTPSNLVAYRARVENKQKLLLNSAAENCIAWIELNGSKEPYQISWVGSHASVTINVGDYRELDFCALAKNLNIIIAPTEGGYSNTPRCIGKVGGVIEGTLRVTSSNGKTAQRRFSIKSPATTGLLDIVFK